jgi:hypothetical protein
MNRNSGSANALPLTMRGGGRCQRSRSRAAYMPLELTRVRLLASRVTVEPLADEWPPLRRVEATVWLYNRVSDLSRSPRHQSSTLFAKSSCLR